MLFALIVDVILCLLAYREVDANNTGKKDTDNGEEVMSTYSTEEGGGNLAMTLPIRGPEGRRGPSGPRGIPGLPAPKIQRTAFFAGLSTNLGPLDSHSDVKFDRSLTNVGDCYSKDTGHFTAKINGWSNATQERGYGDNYLGGEYPFLGFQFGAG